MNQNLKGLKSNYKIHVSLDKKIFMLLSDLENEIKKGKIDKKQTDKKLKFIKSEMKSDI
jgi:hypothetical protein